MSENDSSDSDSSDVESVSVGKKRAAIKGRKKKVYFFPCVKLSRYVSMLNVL